MVDPEINIRESHESNNVTRILINYTQPPKLSDGPANDQFANAFPISGVAATVLSHNTNATLEVGEPAHNPVSTGGRSVWWRWTAPATISALISTAGSRLDTLLAVYQGSSLTDLTRLAYSDDATGIGSNSLVTFQATAGTTYFIAVDGYHAGIGSIQLHLNPDWNDFFANSLPLA